VFSISAKKKKSSMNSLIGSVETNKSPLIPVDGQHENIDAGWMSFGRFILDLFRFAIEIIGGTYSYLRGFHWKKEASKERILLLRHT